MVASLLLSLALVYIYISLRDIQGSQIDILQNQESLMRLQELPNIKITSWDGDGDNLKFTLANIGQGVANNISAGVKIHPQNIEYHENFDLRTKPLYQMEQGSRIDFLNGKETSSFVSPAIATTVVDNVQHWEFTRIINHICGKGEIEIEFIVVIEYSDLFGERTEIRVTSRRTEIHRGMSFEEALRDSAATNTVARHLPSRTELERFEELDQTGIFFDPTKES